MADTHQVLICTIPTLMTRLRTSVVRKAATSHLPRKSARRTTLFICEILLLNSRRYGM